MSQTQVEVSRDGPVAVVRMTNEASLNSMTWEMRHQTRQAFEDADADPDVRAIYLTGSGRAFSAGGDLPMLKSAGDAYSTHKRFRIAAQWLNAIARTETPIVAGVNGYAVGGGMGLALACDVIVAGEGARFRAGFFKLGAVPDIAMMYFLPRLIGLARAKAFIFGNGEWTGREALDAGIAVEVTADEDLDAVGLARAHALADGPAEAIGLAKLLMARSFETGFDDFLFMEGLAQATNFQTRAFAEGLDAMTARRPADFAAASADEPWNRFKKGAE